MAVTVETLEKLERKMTLTLKTEGDKLTGTLSSPGRNDQANETAISDGKVKGDEVSFSVTREYHRYWKPLITDNPTASHSSVTQIHLASTANHGQRAKPTASCCSTVLHFAI